MKATTLALLIALAPAPAWAYGAIALGVCRTPGSGWGISYNQPSAAIANAVAIRECSKHTSNCRVVMPIIQQCFAVALDFSNCGRDGEAAAQYLSVARRGAYQSCQRLGGVQCTIVAGVCDVHN
jgi:Domain of unknown function (DUF4189)